MRGMARPGFSGRRPPGQGARGPTKTLGLIRGLARNAEQLSLADALGAERTAQRDAGRTEDFRTAVMAFLRKQPATFEGR